MLGQVFRKLAESRGYTLRDAREAPAGFRTFLRQCLRRGLDVDTVIDVGVGYGTPWLYDSFPTQELLLFEPLGEVFGDAIARITATRQARHFPVALGAQVGEATIQVAGATPTSSTLLQASEGLVAALSHEGRNSSYQTHTVRVDVLDRYVDQVGRNALKIDAEGFELPILRGGTELLRKSELVILEVSLIRRYDGEAMLDQILPFMSEQGFALYEIIELSRRRAGAPTTFMDVAFVPAASPLRSFR
ncbi:MAG: FkbM family methyltransferase [Pseudomonadota bacterium]